VPCSNSFSANMHSFGYHVCPEQRPHSLFLFVAYAAISPSVAYSSSSVSAVILL
jgi:hypothetical protein